MSGQTITINYTPEGRLSLLDATTKQPLYHVKVSRQTPQIEMIRLTGHEETGAFPDDADAYFASRVCTAQFKITSLDVKMRIREQRDVELKRKKVLSTSYTFVSPSLSAGSPESLTWEADSENNAVGNFKLVVEGQGTVLVRFRNATFSTEQVGTFEVASGLDQLVKDEAVISGLAMLTMNQSFHLAGMIMFKSP
ncbi:hypothetical protein POX_c04785 [Penicillium oxalicum]|uniref:hypothetical protein n=1 Tax=Penicillium oxalicum TaxID=69781 RepID=UPI0020B72A4A|nr:hypothetical protein POX_c04785 [Penicillium oxalicum]KAI2791905.1 hypothetical protein POX_c04785 [Penicillium oxalicum]